MTELLDILKRTINFMDKYQETSISGEPNSMDEIFWSQEEMDTAFYYKNHFYYIYQYWDRDAYKKHYSFTLYRDGEETNIDPSFIRVIYDILSKKYE